MHNYDQKNNVIKCLFEQFVGYPMSLCDFVNLFALKVCRICTDHVITDHLKFSHKAAECSPYTDFQRSSSSQSLPLPFFCKLHAWKVSTLLGFIDISCLCRNSYLSCNSNAYIFWVSHYKWLTQKMDLFWLKFFNICEYSIQRPVMTLYFTSIFISVFCDTYFYFLFF